MCLGDVYWARPEKVFFARTREDAANIDFDDNFLYKDMEKIPAERELPMISLMREDSLSVFEKLGWQSR